MTPQNPRPLRIDHDPGKGHTYYVDGTPVDPPTTRVEFVPGKGSTYYVGDAVVDLGAYLAVTLGAIAARPVGRVEARRGWADGRREAVQAATAAREVVRLQRVRDGLIANTTATNMSAISRNRLATLMKLRRQEVYRLCKILLDDPTSGVVSILPNVPHGPITVLGMYRDRPWPLPGSEGPVTAPPAAPGDRTPPDAAPPPPPADSGQRIASWPTPRDPDPLEPVNRPPYVGPDATGRIAEIAEIAEVPGLDPIKYPAPLPYLGPSAPLHPDLARILGRLP